MSRSVRRRPYAAYCGGSQKQAKRHGNRALRHQNRLRLQAAGEDAVFQTLDEALNLWAMPQDGSRHYHPYDGKMDYWLWFRWVKRK